MKLVTWHTKFLYYEHYHSYISISKIIVYTYELIFHNRSFMHAINENHVEIVCTFSSQLSNSPVDYDFFVSDFLLTHVMVSISETLEIWASHRLLNGNFSWPRETIKRLLWGENAWCRYFDYVKCYFVYVLL